MHAVILSAGQGKRLLPLTADKPKCLLPFAGRTILEWQVRALSAAGIEHIHVVTGFQAARVEEEARRLSAELKVPVETRFNPFFGVADNLGSCFVVRDLLRGNGVIANGDTLFEPEIARRVLSAPSAQIRITVDRKPAYDEDDMKVSLDGDRVLAVGKTLTPAQTQAESIGLLRFEAEGFAAFAEGVEEVLRRPDGLRRWYLSVVSELAAEGRVRMTSIEGLTWSEVDFPADLARAEETAAKWR
ncbi:phosphocholine cytidylyltransferase family protein [Roseomonas elaeocarpi]|uniref:Sugar phosphate nucleotidyltransferase n=1 Tax=Roseomonas elaeocarpi TaxID=907779 RepID=A0ABV6JQL7_9PROT